MKFIYQILDKLHFPPNQIHQSKHILTVRIYSNRYSLCIYVSFILYYRFVSWGIIHVKQTCYIILITASFSYFIVCFRLGPQLTAFFVFSYFIICSDRWGGCKLYRIRLCSGYSGNSLGSFKYHIQVWLRFKNDLTEANPFFLHWLRFLCNVRCSAVLAHFILDEKLHPFGVVGCILCLVGSVAIVLHAPLEKDIESVKQVWRLATEPGIWRFSRSLI